MLNTNGTVSDFFVANCAQLGHLIYLHKHKDKVMQVRQLGELRWLLINYSLQSVINRQYPTKLLFPHLVELANIWKTLRAPDSVLELGLGGGAIRNFLSTNYPEVKITTVEQDTEIIHCYGKYFAKSKYDTIVCGDATQNISPTRAFDWIILDLFSSDEAPRFLFNADFYQSLAHAMQFQGYLFINFIAEDESQLTQLLKILKATFQKQPHLIPIPHYRNHIIWLQAD